MENVSLSTDAWNDATSSESDKDEDVVASFHASVDNDTFSIATASPVSYRLYFILIKS